MLRVSCPICNAQVPKSAINKHLDSQCSPSVVLEPQACKSKGPLAQQCRPTAFDEMHGQSTASTNGILKKLFDMGSVPSLILWGPPGCGKTTLARILGSKFYMQEYSAAVNNIEQLRKAEQIAKAHTKTTSQRSVIFLDEIHRFTKSQQDMFLPAVERGDYILIAATTENPSFRINSALLSRCRVFCLEKLDTPALINILKRGVEEKSKDNKVDIPDIILDKLAAMCDGDARVALNCLDMVIDSSAESNTPITLENVAKALEKSHSAYDRNGDCHYDCISALHKSMRGDDQNASLYWLGRMLYSGEDPIYIARRLVRFAAEDIGVANPLALTHAVAALNGCQAVGMPECDVILANSVVYLANSVKSVSVYQALKNVKKHCLSHAPLEVPIHLRNAPTQFMKDLGYAKDYKYNPAFDGPVEQSYLPEGCDIDFFQNEQSDIVCQQNPETYAKRQQNKRKTEE